jgi:acyl-CoA dehydrogenase
MLRKPNLELSFSEEQAMLLESAREFCRNNSSIAQVRSLLHSKNSSEHAGYDPELWQQVVELGWLGVAIPEQFGGSELGIGTTVCLAEAMGRSMLATPFLSTTIAAQAIIRGGTAQQKEHWLPKIEQGAVASMAVLENEDWGSSEYNCQLVKDGDQLTLSGKKVLVCDAVSAELFVVAANYKAGDVPEQTVLVLVEATSLATNAMSAHTLVDESKRASTINFNGSVIAESAIMALPKAAATLHDINLIGALLTAAEAVGSTAASLDTTVEYLKTRKQFGKLIGSYQSLKHPTVDILCEMDSAKSLVYHAASILGEGELSQDAEIACRMAKSKATEALLYAGDRGIQFHGGMGFTYECDAQLYIRRAQWSQQQYGDAQHHRKRLAPLLLD